MPEVRRPISLGVGTVEAPENELSNGRLEIVGLIEGLISTSSVPLDSQISDGPPSFKLLPSAKLGPIAGKKVSANGSRWRPTGF